MPHRCTSSVLSLRHQIRSTCLREAATAKAGEIRNSKWFDRLTTLSEVEGQCRMTKIPMTQTWWPIFSLDKCTEDRLFCHWDIRISDLFRTSIFEFRIYGNYCRVRHSHGNLATPKGHDLSRRNEGVPWITPESSNCVTPTPLPPLLHPPPSLPPSRPDQRCFSVAFETGIC